ncbi:MAG: hypothetical protein Q9195_007477 [Heterodermia aff. obscurata]
MLPSLGVGVFTAVTLCLFVIVSTWFRLVNNIVHDPYLDEVFHYHQAKLFLQNNFHEWNPKITTPAGLYVLQSDPTPFQILKYISNLWYILTYVHANLGRILLASGTVTVTWLRRLNYDIGVFCLPYLLGEILPQLADDLDKNYAFAYLRSKTKGRLAKTPLGHTVLNICLFPPLFFFYALYYTDVSSTLSVLCVYYCYLQGHRRSLVVAGLVSLWFRQTNIFWIAIFTGGLELVRSLKKGRCGFEYAASPTFADVILGSWRYTCIYDESVHQALFAAYVKSAVSIAVAILSGPWAALTIIMPYLILLIAFGSFVIWNGGVVLGLAIVHYNTIVHPFTLADNRHYMFYIFRILLSQRSLKYLVVPVYGYCAWAAIAALGGLESTQDFSTQKNLDGVVAKEGEHSLKTSDEPAKSTPQGNRVTFVLVWLFTTTFCLVTAPLVEPRYSILAWLFWRLQLPISQPVIFSQKGHSVRNNHAIASLDNTYDHRLIIETAWFMLINVVTGYLFLYKGFEWPQEPANVQRFMW